MSVRARLLERGRRAAAPATLRAAAPTRLEAAERPGAVTAGRGPGPEGAGASGPAPAVWAAGRPTRIGQPGAGPRPAHVAPEDAAPTAAPDAPPNGPAAGKAAFALLALFIVVLYTRPQDLLPILGSLRLAFVLGVAGAAAYAVDVVRRGEPVVRPHREVFLLGAFVALAVASVPLGLWPGQSLARIADQLLKVVLAFVLVSHVVDTVPRARLLVGILAAAGAYLSIGALATRAAGGVDRYAGRAEGLVGGMFRDPNDLAITLVILMSLAGFQLVVSRRAVVRLLCAGAVAVMLAAFLATLSRGGLVALAVAAAVGAARLARHGRGVAIAAVAFLAVLGGLAAPEGYSERAASIVTREGDTGSIEARLTTLRYGAEILIEHPVVGVGIGNFRIAEGAKHGGVGKWNEAHNAFLQVGAELGWAGLAVYLALTVCAVRNARAIARRAAGRPELLGLGHGLETAIAGFLAGALFLSQAYTWHFYILLGLTVALRRIAEATPVLPEEAPAATRPRPMVAGAARHGR